MIAVTGDNYTGIWVARADGSELQQVSDATGAGYQMSWQGTDIISTPYSMENNKRMTRIERVNAVTGKIEQQMPATRNFKRSAVTARATDVLRVMVDNPREATAMIDGLKDYAGKWVINPALSPDGSKIAFQIATRGLFVCNADGSGLTCLGKGSHASWLHDSRHLMATRITDNGHSFTASDIYCVDTESGKATCITATSETIPVTIAVSPDGRRLAFDNDTDGVIYIINLNY